MSEDASPKLAHSIESVRRTTDLGRTFIYNAIRSGELEARKAGRRTIILDTDLRDWLARLPSCSAHGEAS